MEAAPTSSDRALSLCALCCEEKPKSEICVLAKCSHESCGECFVRWIEKVESTGQSKLPGCPFCRVEISREEVKEILGRSYKPKAAAAFGGDSINLDHDDMMDELTRQLLEQQTTPCPSCGARIEKVDGCDLMECLCGYRFCFRCGCQGAHCFCTPPSHRFWDNILDCSASRTAPARAPTNFETGQVELREYLERRRQEGADASDDPMDRWFDSDDSRCHSPVPAELYRPPSPTYSPMSHSGRAMALESADFLNARHYGQPEAPPPPPPYSLDFNQQQFAPCFSTSFCGLAPLPLVGSQSPQYSVTSAAFSPLRGETGPIGQGPNGIIEAAGTAANVDSNTNGGWDD